MSSTRSNSTRSSYVSYAARDNALSIYTAQLEAYVKKYIVSFDGSESVEEWSSRHADRFSKTVNDCVPRAVVLRDISERVSKVAPTRLTVTRYHLAHAEPWSEGRSQFNKFLFSEFETWYSAFEAEAEDEGPSAASRWAYHCAKKLARTGLAVDALVPVVEAWLNTHLE